MPSGIWDAEEYEKLPEYDRETFDQPTSVFMCHQGEGDLCSGWLGHDDPTELLSLRLAVMNGSADPSCFDYETDVPLFESGQAAAEHGVREITDPSEKAQSMIGKIVRKRSL